jgi:hypothetical protein
MYGIFQTQMVVNNINYYTENELVFTPFFPVYSLSFMRNYFATNRDWLSAVICSTWSLNHSVCKVNEYVLWYALNPEERERGERNMSCF